MKQSRRSFLAAAGTAAAVAGAGCLGGGEGNAGPYGGYLADARLFDGSVADRTGQSEVRIKVGAGDGLAFDPPAVKISPGTTVIWEWTGKGGKHNVKAVNGAFQSQYYASAGQTFTHKFTNPGVVKYVCVPHRGAGMKGVIDVVEG